MNIQRLVEQVPLDDTTPWWLAIDVADVLSRVDALCGAFGDGVLHTVAIKACPILPVVLCVVGRGAGVEAASMGEVDVALAAGCRPEDVVFDSPVKTVAELRRALELGVAVNADNLEEVARIDALRGQSSSRVGLRVNPEVGAGTIAATSVAVRNGKFGVSLERRREAIEEAFARRPWLDGVHVHVGSQGMGLDLLVEGVARAAGLAEEVGAVWLDIGGGLPVAYREGDRVITPGAYVEALTERVPGLFDRFRIVTEFGRWVFTASGIAVSRVEYVKPAADIDVVAIHFGANLLLRELLGDDPWYREITVHAPDGTRRTADPRGYLLGGPLCFSGDVLACDVSLPRVHVGDLVCVHDVGAYTFSMWSRFCSRPFPPVLVTEGDQIVDVVDGQTPDDVVKQWS